MSVDGAAGGAAVGVVADLGTRGPHEIAVAHTERAHAKNVRLVGRRAARVARSRRAATHASSPQRPRRAPSARLVRVLAVEDRSQRASESFAPVRSQRPIVRFTASRSPSRNDVTVATNAAGSTEVEGPAEDSSRASGRAHGRVGLRGRRRRPPPVWRASAPVTVPSLSYAAKLPLRRLRGPGDGVLRRAIRWRGRSTSSGLSATCGREGVLDEATERDAGSSVAASARSATVWCGSDASGPPRSCRRAQAVDALECETRGSWRSCRGARADEVGHARSRHVEHRDRVRATRQRVRPGGASLSAIRGFRTRALRKLGRPGRTGSQHQRA